MRVLITEEQFNILKDLYMLNENVEDLNESFDLQKLIQKYKAALTAGIAASAIILSINGLHLPGYQKDLLKKEVGVEMVDSTQRQKRIDAVDKYITIALTNQNFSKNNLQLSPEKIVDICDENNFDLPLLLAQAHLESCFGMTNRARRTNSVWSVGSYDNGKNVCTYPNQNSSILPYINLMKNNYLADKTIDELLTPGNFVNTKGQRYASDKNYENKVKNLRNKILGKYPELA